VATSDLLSRMFLGVPSSDISCIESRTFSRWQHHSQWTFAISDRFFASGSVIPSLLCRCDVTVRLCYVVCRLVKANACPANDTELQQSSCADCLQTTVHRRSGRTSFSRVRLNITTLQVISRSSSVFSLRSRSTLALLYAGYPNRTRRLKFSPRY